MHIHTLRRRLSAGVAASLGILLATSSLSAASAAPAPTVAGAQVSAPTIAVDQGLGTPTAIGIAETKTPVDQLVLSPDVTGNGHGDAFVVDAAGRLFLYAGSRSGSLYATKSYGLGWDALDVFAPGDWSGDGRPDVVAETAAGDLMLYRGSGGGALGAAQKIGNGWTGFRIVPAGDVSGDRVADLLAIDPKGLLWLYPGNGRGGFGKRVQVGNGWSGFELYAGGDMNRDGRADILGIDSAGRLWFYAGRGGGYFAQRQQVGNGWTGYELSSGADVNRDGIGDLIGRDPAGKVFFYAGKPGGGFSTRVAAALSAAPAPGAGGSLTNGCQVSERGVPACGALVGAAVGSNTDPGSFESAVGGRLGVRRTFFSPTGVAGAVRIAQADAAAGRVSWMSFKVPHSWAEMAAGKGDAWAADLTRRLGAVNGTVWVAFHHEPENDGPIRDWVAMQRRLSPVVRAAAPNVAFSMIVTGWNQFYGPSEYAMEAIWPGDGLVDIVGLDLYNTYGQVKNGVTSYETTDMRSRYFVPMQAFAAKHDVAWGLAEVGYTHASSDVDPQWMTRTYDHMAAAGGVAFAYFHTSLNNEVGNWPLNYGSKTSVFSSILARSPRLN